MEHKKIKRLKWFVILLLLLVILLGGSLVYVMMFGNPIKKDTKKEDKIVTKEEIRIPETLEKETEMIVPYIANTAAFLQNNGTFDENKTIYTIIDYLVWNATETEGIMKTIEISKKKLDQMIYAINPSLTSDILKEEKSDVTGFAYDVIEKDENYLFKFPGHGGTTMKAKETNRIYQNKKITISYTVSCSSADTDQTVIVGKEELIFDYDQDTKKYYLEQTTYQKTSSEQCLFV